MFSKRRKSESQVHPEINFEEVREDHGRQLAAYLDQGLLQVIGLQTPRSRLTTPIAYL